MTSFAKRAFHGAVLVILLGIVSNVLAYGLRLILARSLPQEDFGLFYAVVAVVGLLYIVTHLGLNDALTRHIATSRVRENLSSIKEGILLVLGIEIAIAVLVVGAVALLAPWLQDHYFHHAGAALVLIIHAGGMILLPFETLFISIFQGFQRMSLLGSVNVLRMAFVVLFSFIFLKMGLGVLSPALGYLTWYGVAIIVYTPVVLKKVIPGFFAIPYELTSKLSKDLLAFGLPVIFSSVAGVVISSTDTIMLTGLRKSLQEVAVYNVAMPTASILWFFSAGLAIVLFPITSELWERKYHDHLTEGIELVYRYSFMVMVPASLALAVFPEIVLSTLFGQGYESGAPVLQVLALGGILFMFGRINEAFFSGMGVPKKNSRIVWTGALVNIVFNAFLIPQFGMMGAAIGTVISFGAIFAMGTYYIRKQVQFNVPWMSWGKTVTASMVFVAVLWLLKSALNFPVWPRIILSTILAFMAYVGVLFLLRAVTIHEIKMQVQRVW